MTEIQNFPTWLAPLEAAIRRGAEKTAIEFDGVSTSYDELNDFIMRSRRALSDCGVSAGTRVGVHLDRSPQMIAILIAVLSLRANYVPIDVSLPDQRKAYMAADSGLAFLVSSRSLDFDLPGGQTIRVEDVALRLPTPVRTEVPIHGEDEQNGLAYTIYTSGSTGRPKGVKIGVRSLLNFIESMSVRPGIFAGDRVLSLTSISFDVFVLEYLVTLWCGGTIVLANNQQRIDGHALSRLIEASAATVMQATPTAWRMLLVSGWKGSKVLRALTGGEAITPRLAKELVGKTKQLWNMYGPTETTVWSTCAMLEVISDRIPVGQPIKNTGLHIQNNEKRGELVISGVGLLLGYTDPRFEENCFAAVTSDQGETVRGYRTGDMAEIDKNGNLFIIGRADSQVKINGHRVELSEIEDVANAFLKSANLAASIREMSDGEVKITAFIGDSALPSNTLDELRQHLATFLPFYMLPSEYSLIANLPLTISGKIDRRKLLELSVALSKPEQGNIPALEGFKNILAKHLGGGSCDASANIFDLGLTSLGANRLVADIRQSLGIEISVADIFASPKIRDIFKLADSAVHTRTMPPGQQLADKGQPPKARVSNEFEPVAVIGMAGRFPGANNVEELWPILVSGRETLTRFEASEDDLSVPEHIRNDRRYVRARGMLQSPELFDADLFGIGANEARIMDPQQRVFLELALEAFENAGYDTWRHDGLIGSFAGMGNNHYYEYNVSTHPSLIRLVGDEQVEVGREKDHIATIVSHRLDLRGPSISLNTACSTGLVAIDAACHALLSGQCDLALAGAIELRTPQMSGQIGEVGGIFSEDGHCRPFSNLANGTMFSDGAGAIILKKLSDAERDGDYVHAIIRSTAVNHDGIKKRSYLAPSVLGQISVIETALRKAHLSAREVSYVEAHGTATPVGDPIEFNALKWVFEKDTVDRNFCDIGSVKANLGHPTTSAGVVGLIKICLALRHRTIPPLANFNAINPNINISNSPFRISEAAREWTVTSGTRIAGVSSFGFCGTNAHALVEEYQDERRLSSDFGDSSEPLLMLYSGHSEVVLKQNITATEGSAQARKTPMEAAYTLSVGRAKRRFRQYNIISSTASGIEVIAKSKTLERQSDTRPKLIFAFPGQGSQYSAMGSDLYRSEPVFRETFDRVSEIVRGLSGICLVSAVLEGRVPISEGDRALSLDDTSLTQPALFAVEVSLMKLLTHWGLTPDVVVGHSIGEYAAGVCAGVLDIAAAARAVTLRGKTMFSMKEGSMLTVTLPAGELLNILPPSLSVAALNSPGVTVVGGETAQVRAFKAELDAIGVASRLLTTSHAYHTPMMEGAARDFLDQLRETSLSRPDIRFCSTVTGNFADEELTSADYWAQQIVKPVKFSDAIVQAVGEDDSVVVELGPRSNLCTLTQMQNTFAVPPRTFDCMGAVAGDGREKLHLLKCLGNLWQQDIDLDWNKFYPVDARKRVPLPARSFERKRYWLEAQREAAQVQRGETAEIDASENISLAATEASDRSLLDQIKSILELSHGQTIDWNESWDKPFLAIGFDSLQIAPIVFLVRETFGVEISFGALMTNVSTPQKLLDFIGEQRQPSVEERRTSIPRIGCEEDQIPLLKVFLEKVSDEEGLPQDWMLGVRVKFDTDLEPQLFIKALRRLAERHSARVSLDYLRPEQRTSSSLDSSSDHILDDFKQELGERQIAISLVGYSRNCFEVLIRAHPLYCDLWSLDVLIEQLVEICRSLKEKRDIGLPQQPSARDFWQRLTGLNPSPLGMHDALQSAPDLLRRIHFTARSDQVRLDLDDIGTLRGIAKQLEQSVSSIILSCIYLALAHSEFAPVVNLYSVVAGQSFSNLRHLVGNFSGLVRIDLGQEAVDSLTDLPSIVRKCIANQIERQQDTYEELSRSVSNSMAQNPLTVSFMHVARLPERVLISDVGTVGYEIEALGFYPTDVQVVAVEEKLGVKLVVRFNGDKLPFDKAHLLLQNIANSLEVYRTRATGSEGGT